MAVSAALALMELISPIIAQFWAEMIASICLHLRVTAVSAAFLPGETPLKTIAAAASAERFRAVYCRINHHWLLFSAIYCHNTNLF